MAAHDHRVSSAQELVCSHAVSEDGPASTDFLTGLTRSHALRGSHFTIAHNCPSPAPLTHACHSSTKFRASLVSHAVTCAPRLPFHDGAQLPFARAPHSCVPFSVGYVVPLAVTSQ